MIQRVTVDGSLLSVLLPPLDRSESVDVSEQWVTKDGRRIFIGPKQQAADPVEDALELQDWIKEHPFRDTQGNPAYEERLAKFQAMHVRELQARTRAAAIAKSEEVGEDLLRGQNIGGRITAAGKQLDRAEGQMAKGDFAGATVSQDHALNALHVALGMMEEQEQSQAGQLNEFVRKEGSEWIIVGHTGKKLEGGFKSHGEAAARLGQIEWFKKHKKNEAWITTKEGRHILIGEPGRPGEVYHGTAAGVAESIIRDGIRVGQYGETWVTDSRAGALDYAQNAVARRMMRSDQPEDVALVVLDAERATAAGVRSVGGGLVGDKDIPASAVKRVEMYRTSDVLTGEAGRYASVRPFRIVMKEEKEQLELYVVVVPSAKARWHSEQQRKKKVRTGSLAMQRYWMGLGGGFRSQYGDYSQDQRPRLNVVQEGWVTIGGRHVLISIDREGWVTKEGQFHPNEGGEMHSMSAQRLGLSKPGAYDPVGNALSNGHVRVVTYKSGTVGLQADNADANTKQVVKSALDSVPSKNVTVSFRRLGQYGEFDGGTPSQAKSWIDTGRQPSDVARWHSEKGLMEARA